MFDDTVGRDLAAHDIYRLLRMPEAQLDFNGAWVIARDLRVGTAELRSCRRCELRHLVSSGSRLAPTCPFCAPHARRARRSEPRLILSAGIAGSPGDGDQGILLTPSEEDPYDEIREARSLPLPPGRGLG